MSFILDALKKSESERQQQNTPGIASIPHQGTQRASGRWLWLVVILLAVNLVAVAALLLWKQGVPASGLETAGSEQVADTPTTATQPAATRPQQDRVRTIESAALDSAAPIPQAVSEPAPPQTGSVADGLETFNDLRAKGQLQLPDMHLDIHVYSGAPADRFVFVNMSKYKENTTLSEGPRVLEITPEGVVLEHRELRFLLPRE